MISRLLLLALALLVHQSHAQSMYGYASDGDVCHTCYNGGTWTSDQGGSCVCNQGFSPVNCCEQPYCFSADSLVETSDRGFIPISQIHAGDLLRAYETASGRTLFSKFVTYAHEDPAQLARFIQVRTASANQTLKLSDKHLIYAPQRETFVFAEELTLGDALLLGTGELSHVVELSEVLEQGVYAPLTEQGTVLVNNVVASCYSNIRSHNVAHAVMPTVTWMTQALNRMVFKYKDTTEMAAQLRLLAYLEKTPLISDYLVF